MTDTPTTPLPVDSLPRGYNLLNYTILKVLGRGGFGVTYLAHDNDKNIDVVIKENMPASCSARDAATSQVVPLSGRQMEDHFAWALNSFVKEALTLKELEHPNIIRGIELLEGGGTAYYVMHRVDGEDVVRTAQERGGADESFLTPIALKLLDALSYLHGKNVLHRDIKPANILISKSGEPVLIDFGAARELLAAHTQTIMQSQGYTPIEQLQKKGRTGPWTDLYALGATLYELIMGERPPFCTDRLGDDTYVPLSGQPQLMSRFSSTFLSSIDKALALWPQDRWQQAEEWKQALLQPGERKEPRPHGNLLDLMAGVEAAVASSKASSAPTARPLTVRASASRREVPTRTSSSALPPLELLQPAPDAAAGDEQSLRESQAVQQRIIETLATFRIAVTAGDISRGPSVTRYEFFPPQGLRVNRLEAMRKDLMLALRVPSLKVVAPVPGKGTVGIELENNERTPVTLRELLESEPFSASGRELPLALGKDVYGEPLIGDLAAMGHLLVGGTTGSGKSVCLNSIILSLLYARRAEELRLILIDPRVVELQPFRSLPHLAFPFISAPGSALRALRWAARTAERRYRLFESAGVSDIKAYNAACAPSDKLPRLVIVIDELADLMQVMKEDLENVIAELTRKSAAGVHLILSTQTPRHEVLTGIIKAGITSRIAFRVLGPLDSRVILDESGAENLLGKGDCLVRSAGAGIPLTRVQGAIASGAEVMAVASFCAAQERPPVEEAEEEDDFSEVLFPEPAPERVNHQALSAKDAELYERCVNLVLTERKVSTSLLQRRFSIGYGKAALIIDIMEEKGIVGPSRGSAHPREVLPGNEDAPAPRSSEQQGKATSLRLAAGTQESAEAAADAAFAAYEQQMAEYHRLQEEYNRRMEVSRELTAEAPPFQPQEERPAQATAQDNAGRKRIFTRGLILFALFILVVLSVFLFGGKKKNVHSVPTRPAATAQSRPEAVKKRKETPHREAKRIQEEEEVMTPPAAGEAVAEAPAAPVASPSALGLASQSTSFLVGSLYDVTQTPQGKPGDIAFSAENEFIPFSEEQKVWQVLHDCVTHPDSFSPVLKAYYQFPKQLHRSCFYLPKCRPSLILRSFGVENHPAPAAWIALYRGKVRAPMSGTFRFVGTSKDLLAVRINGKVVLETGRGIPSLYKEFPLLCGRRGNLKTQAGRLYWENIRTGVDALHRGYQQMPLPETNEWNETRGGLTAGATFKVKEGKLYPIEILVANIASKECDMVLLIQDMSTSEPAETELFRTDFSLPEPEQCIEWAGGDKSIPLPPYTPDSRIWIAEP